ncbi:PPOX class putative F420-dependent enzyme [Halalkaliarchaeum desulfuricum]|uniref:PPOX class putative F420-dependent enzyme n=1 Tax=Halalkaliarchaeum desulfuricum TaxID=2055893 RepID=A0A343TNC4_9EURY|nr:TIGR03668 family PPOX class F420-dependent oxidoreductase [Halalkaliarchaeum desulfuricum]AUX10596.1 PPOX class putative F420-dependent enzyme [Halalkaliarchaeum desulfuricum]
MFERTERRYLESAPIGRLATVDVDGRPHVVPVCFAFADGNIVTPIDEKPQDVAPRELRRSRNIRENPRVALVVDHYTDNWSELGWVQVRGTATLVDPDDTIHAAAVTALRSKYDQYDAHDLERRPLIRISPGSVRSWGTLTCPDDSGGA